MTGTPNTANSSRALTPIEKALLGTRIDQAHLLLPGLLVAAGLAWVSVRLCQWVGCDVLGFEKTPISAVSTAILLGLIINNVLPLPQFLRPGLTFSVKKVLRLGIMMLGIRLSVFDVFKLGLVGVPIVVGCILGALLLTRLLSRWLRLPERLGTLIAVGTSICGVSAIVATGPAIDAEDEEVAYAVSVITIFGILATFVYPYVAYRIFEGNAGAAGLFLGTAIHDTSQVTGAALIFADIFSLPRAVDVATVTKLVRNVFMAIVIPLMAMLYARKTSTGQTVPGERTRFTKLLPLFVVGFLLFATFRSVGDVGINAGGQAFGLWESEAWDGIVNWIKRWAVNLLVVALAGVGLSTSARILRGLGFKPFLAGLGAAIGVGGISVLLISLLGMFVNL
jgi:uncharacterized integral membrane protein (TIGR00698 family)